MRLARWIMPAAGLAAIATLLWLERTRPLRRRVQPGGYRVACNVAVAAAGALTLQVAQKPLVGRLARLVEQRRWGVLQRMPLPRWLETLLGILLLDYSLYVWHVLLHRMSVLWRFHVVHHADLDLDVTTALRFHFGELALSIPWRAAQVLLIGVRPQVLQLWQQATLASIVFHHSNLRLPPGLERWLVWIVVTPRMHGIHHSIIEAETNSNWSSGLTLWDRLHGTLRLDVPQDAITIGVPAYRNPKELALGRILAMPFRTRPRTDGDKNAVIAPRPAGPAGRQSTSGPRRGRRAAPKPRQRR